MNKFKEANKKIEETVVNGYKTIEDGVVSGYKTIEDSVVGSYKKIEDKFVDTFLSPKEENEQETDQDGTKE